MSPINTQTIQTKLVRLMRNIELLEGYAKIDREQFSLDYTVHGAAMHYLVESIEIIVDIGGHILSEEFSVSPGTYKDVILELGKVGVTSVEFAGQNAEMTDFRNLIIHGYGSVNLDQVHAHLRQAPAVFREFASQYAAFLEKK